MEKFGFAIVVSEADPTADDFEQAFFDAGCDDATVSVQSGEMRLEFDRMAHSLEDAVSSATADIRKTGAEVVRVEFVDEHAPPSPTP